MPSAPARVLFWPEVLDGYLAKGLRSESLSGSGEST